MQDDRDPTILRLFAEQEGSSPSDDFMARLGKRIDARQRKRRMRRVAAIASCLALSILVAPLVAEAASTVVGLAAAAIRSGGTLRHEPLVWLVLGATAFGWSPVVYLWRTGRW